MEYGLHRDCQTSRLGLGLSLASEIRIRILGLSEQNRCFDCRYTERKPIKISQNYFLHKQKQI